MLKKLLLSGMLLSLAILLGRFAGFFREILLAAKMGVSHAADMAILLLTIPDFLSNLLVGGAIGAAFIPVFRQHQKTAPDLLLQASIVSLLVLIGVTSVADFYCAQFVHWFAPGITQRALQEVAIVMRIAFWSFPITVLAGLTTAYLQSRDRFFIAGCGTLLVNIAIVIALLLGMAGERLLYIAVAILIGAMIRWGSQILVIFLQERPKLTREGWQIPIALWIRYVQAAAAGAILLFLPVIARALASFGHAGSMAVFNYAYKLMQFPFAICFSVFGVILLPKLSELFVTAEDKAVELAQEGAFFAVMLSFSVSVVLAWFSKDIAHIVYGWGKVTHHDAIAISQVFTLGVLALPALGLSVLSTATFNAKKDTRTPCFINVAALFIFVILAKEFSHAWGLAGIMIALTAIYWVIALLQASLLHYRYQINIWRSLVSINSLQYTVVFSVIFALFAYLSPIIPQIKVEQLLFMLISGISSLMIGMMTLGKYRSVIIRLLKNRGAK